MKDTTRMRCTIGRIRRWSRETIAVASVLVAGAFVFACGAVVGRASTVSATPSKGSVAREMSSELFSQASTEAVVSPVSPLADGFHVGIGRTEYCQQIALSTLISQTHVIGEEQVIFMRDARKPGNAIQQFAEIFGRAIETGMNPYPSVWRHGNGMATPRQPTE